MPHFKLEDLNKDIQEGDVDAFNQRLAEIAMFFQVDDDDNTLGERLAASGALCYAARVGSVPIMDTLIQKGVGKAVYQLIGLNYHTLTYFQMMCSIVSMTLLHLPPSPGEHERAPH